MQGQMPNGAPISGKYNENIKKILLIGIFFGEDSAFLLFLLFEEPLTFIRG
jgi:hypothetical protein